MKIMTIALLLLAAIAGQGQDLKTGTTSFYIRDTTPLYDTAKVIAKVYQAAYKIHSAQHWEWSGDSVGRFVQDSTWSWDSTEVRTKKVLAWEVWTSECRKYPSIPIKYLAYNRKDELTNVLQTWRPKEFESVIDKIHIQ